MTQVIIGAILATIAFITSVFFYGRRVQSQVDIGKASTAALKAREKAEKANTERAKHDATIIPTIPDAWPNDTDDLHFVMPGGPTSPSNKPGV